MIGMAGPHLPFIWCTPTLCPCEDQEKTSIEKAMKWLISGDSNDEDQFYTNFLFPYASFENYNITAQVP